MAYTFSTWFSYCDNVEMEKDEFLPRLLVSSLNNIDEFVCCAFSNIFSGLLKKLGIDSTIEHIKIYTDVEKNIFDFHVNNLVMLNDEKYGFNGLVMADACNDSGLGQFYESGKGEELFNAGGERSLTLSAINLDDFNKTRGIFRTGDSNFLKLFHENPEILIGDDYQTIFECFLDCDVLKYLNFFARNYPEFKEVVDLNFDLSLGELDKIDLISKDIAKMMGEVFGDELIVAAAVEKQDLSQQDYTVITYNCDIDYLFEQLVIMKYCGLDDDELKKYLLSRKQEIEEETKGFDSEFEIEKVLEHNKKIASRYFNEPEFVEELNVQNYFTDYKNFSSGRAFLSLFLFDRRKTIFDMFKEIKGKSPIVETDDYIVALSTILQAQGYPSEKINGYLNHILDLTVNDAYDWFEDTSNNCFLREYCECFLNQENKKD